jgi:Flp pilus assembly pilin Flp
MANLAAWIQRVAAARGGDEQGANMLEYGLLVTLIAMVAVAAVQALGGDVLGLYDAGVAAFR